MQQPVKDGGSDDLVSGEHFDPLPVALVARQDDRTPFVATGDHLEEKTGLIGIER